MDTSATCKEFGEGGNSAYPHVIDVSRAAVNSTLTETLLASAGADNDVWENSQVSYLISASTVP